MFVFRKFSVLCFLETPVLRFAILHYYRQKLPNRNSVKVAIIWFEMIHAGSKNPVTKSCNTSSVRQTWRQEKLKYQTWYNYSNKNKTFQIFHSISEDIYINKWLHIFILHPLQQFFQTSEKNVHTSLNSI